MGVCVSKSDDSKQEIKTLSSSQAKALDDKQDLQPNGSKDSTNKDAPQEDYSQNLKGGVTEIDNNQDMKRGQKKKKAKIEAIGEEEQIMENIQKQNRNKKPFDYQLILNALSNNYVFKLLNDSDMENIVEKMFYCITKDNQFIFQQGDQASSYFIIERGQCQIIINNDPKKTLKNGESFGELALLYGAPRSASVKALGDCAFWAIDRNTFRKAVEEIVARDYEDNRKFMQEVKFFQSMTEEQKDAIANVLITQVFKKGEIIVNEGDQADSYYIIKSGTVSVMKGTQNLRNMTKGDSFGEQALFQNSKRGATVKALDEEVRCLALGRDTLTKILGDKVQVIMYNNLLKWALEKHAILSKLTKIQVEKIVSNMKQISYKKGDVLFQKGEKCKNLIVVLEAALRNDVEDKEIISKGQMYGDIYLQNQDQPMKETLMMTADGIIAEISFDQFIECIGGQLDQVFIKNANSHEVKYMMKTNQNKNDNSHIKLEDLIFIKKLGFGQFGVVYLVKNKLDSKFYALKSISKAQIIEQNLEKHLAQEKHVLETVQFPLIMQFIRSFKNDNLIFFLVEYIKGLELFDVIREIGLLNTYDSQFYIGSLIVCMEYMHNNNIIYRDIKPENIMVDQKGYMKLIDMGTAKFLKGKGGKTFTIIGTPHYMAPEIITGKGYTFSVDLWSIGICLYEFMCGGVPFAEDAEDPYEIYEEIIKKNLNYPAFLKDRKAKKLMDQLLNKTPELRLGGSYASLKANSWFDHFDWDKLLDRELKSPYQPPKEKMVTEKEIQKQEKEGRSVVSEIEKEQQPPYKKDNVKDLNWDKDY